MGPCGANSGRSGNRQLWTYGAPVRRNTRARDIVPRATKGPPRGQRRPHVAEPLRPICDRLGTCGLCCVAAVRSVSACSTARTVFLHPSSRKPYDPPAAAKWQRWRNPNKGSRFLPAIRFAYSGKVSVTCGHPPQMRLAIRSRANVPQLFHRPVAGAGAPRRGRKDRKMKGWQYVASRPTCAPPSCLGMAAAPRRCEGADTMHEAEVLACLCGVGGCLLVCSNTAAPVHTSEDHPYHVVQRCRSGREHPRAI